MPLWLPVLLGFLSAVGPVSTDMYLPAFPAIEASFRLPEGSAQITLATWFAGLAVGQITQGTLSDRFGRRWPLLVGTVVYTLGTAGCALAPSLASLSACRIVAAFGGSAGMVIPRAVVRDLAEGHAAARLFSRLTLVMGAAPILAPTLGGAVLGVASWRMIFWFGFAYGVLCSLCVALWLPDTLPVAARMRLGLVALLRRYVAIARERSFITHAGIGGFTMFGMFAYLGGSPPVFIELFRVPPALYGVLFGTCAAGYIAASQLNPLLLPRFGASVVLRTAVLGLLLATAVLMLNAAMRWGGLAGVFLPIALAMFCNGFIMPNAVVGALSRHAAHAGSASALMGTLQFILGAASGTVIGWLTDGTARPMGALMLLGALGAGVADRARPRS